MTPHDVIPLVGAWLAVGLLPGLLVTVGLRWGRGWLRALVIAPLVSYGVLMLVAVALTVVGVSVEPTTVLPLALVVGLLCLAVGWLRHTHVIEPEVVAARAAELLPLALIVIASATCWWMASDGLAAVPPNDDGSNHGLFATQILNERTIAPSQVVVGDVLTDKPSAAYYPLAIHLVAALMARISGGPVASALTLQVVVAMALLPAGMFVLTRRLYPLRPGVGPVAALVSVMFVAMPYYVATWGGYPFIIGIALVPIAVDALCGAGRDTGAIRGGLLVGLVLVGLFAVHSSEMLAALGLALLVLIGCWARRERRIVESLAPWLVGVVVVSLFIVPQWAQLRAGANVVATAALIAPQSPLAAIVGSICYVPFLAFPSLLFHLPLWVGVLYLVSGAAVLALVVGGAVVSVRRRWSPEWVVGLVLVIIVVIVSALRVPIVDALTVPWYSRSDRLVMNEIFLFSPLAALGAVSLLTRISRVSVRSLAVVAAAGLVAAPALVVSRGVVDAAYEQGSLAGIHERAAFDWLATRVSPGERVLNDPADGSGWMWTLSGVPPLFAVAPHQIEGWGNRTVLIDSASEVGSDLAVRGFADLWRVRYAYVGPRVFPEHEASLSVRQLVDGGGWRVVFRSGGATVLQRVDTQ
ncbi:MAG: hypothetical protein F2842_04495 [Actinobacteria bacterium]|uniref:Unannotated protein n=1 Tax=freshwater metagenome TaxID=449393 RepID=A0A6J7JF29_9ZZZZ|nr:hypothetical protein [Actinomycetota bacterium]